jgi:hypothetical protein
VRLVHIAVAKQRFFRFLHFWTISLPTGLFCKKWQFFVLHTKIYIADRAFFDQIFSFWHKPSKVKNRKKYFCEKTRFFKKVNFAFFCPSRFFGKKSQIEIFRVFFKIVQ